MMRGDHALQPRQQLARGDFAQAPGRRQQQARGRRLAVDQRLQNAAATGAEQVGDDAGDLDVGVIQRFCRRRTC